MKTFYLSNHCGCLLVEQMSKMIFFSSSLYLYVLTHNFSLSLFLFIFFLFLSVLETLKNLN